MYHQNKKKLPRGNAAAHSIILEGISKSKTNFVETNTITIP